MGGQAKVLKCDTHNCISLSVIAGMDARTPLTPVGGYLASAVVEGITTYKSLGYDVGRIQGSIPNAYSVGITVKPPVIYILVYSPTP